ncbi:hypothetical protein BpHYR1_053484 [Brachionus plicatilis]|uniref:Uncharacterized protein n=1 Tax=Brachionus plicatilis TaxID=10195 RepID=A0A3M7R3X4_BRAPC|nr:hypothetical protein BpHYR1_053484 [Brachionus plicatilis]
MIAKEDDINDKTTSSASVINRQDYQDPNDTNNGADEVPTKKTDFGVTLYLEDKEHAHGDENIFPTKTKDRVKTVYFDEEKQKIIKNVFNIYI